MCGTPQLYSSRLLIAKGVRADRMTKTTSRSEETGGGARISRRRREGVGKDHKVKRNCQMSLLSVMTAQKQGSTLCPTRAKRDAASGPRIPTRAESQLRARRWRLGMAANMCACDDYRV